MDKLLTLLLLALVAAPLAIAFAPGVHPHQERNFQHVTKTQLNVATAFPPPEDSSTGVTGGIIPLGEENSGLLANFNKQEKTSNNKSDQEFASRTAPWNIESMTASAAGAAVLLSMLLMASLSNPEAELFTPTTTSTGTTFSTTLVKQQYMVQDETIDQTIDQSAGFYFF